MVNPITSDTLLSSLTAHWRVGPQTLWRFRWLGPPYLNLRFPLILCFNNNIIKGEDLEPVKCIYPPPHTHTHVALAAVRSKAVVLLLLICCLVASNWSWGFSCCALRFALSNFAIILKKKREERAGCFAFIVLRLSCYCKSSLTLPHGAWGWSAICYCCISWLYSLIWLWTVWQCPTKRMLGLYGFYFISFAPVFSLIYCWVLILAISPCYILIYMF